MKINCGACQGTGTINACEDGQENWPSMCEDCDGTGVLAKLLEPWVLYNRLIDKCSIAGQWMTGRIQQILPDKSVKEAYLYQFFVVINQQQRVWQVAIPEDVFMSTPLEKIYNDITTQLSNHVNQLKFLT